MFDNNVPEQIIKEVTGHKSDCVHNYRRTSDVLKEQASHSVSNILKKIVKKEVKLEESADSEDDFEPGGLSVQQMISNVRKTKAELRGKKYLIARNKLSLKRFREKNKVTIYVNVNIKK